MSPAGKQTHARRSRLDWFYESLSAVALLAAIWDVRIHWSMLPERIPIHFDAAGRPDGWGGRGELLILLGVTVLMALVLTVAESYQRLINIPIRVDRNSPEVRRLLRSMVIAMKAGITVMFVWIADSTIRTAMGNANGLGRAFLPLFLGGTLAPIIYYLVRLKRVPKSA